MKAAAIAILLATLASGQDETREKIYTNSYHGKAPPELTIPEKGWVNAKAPVKLSALKGRVVWLEFSFLA